MLKIFKNPETLLQALADFLVEKAQASIAHSGKFNFVLSGGSSPKKLYELLASDAFRNKVEWEHVFFFFGDERYVPANHPDNNFLMAKKSLLDPLNIADDHVFAIDTNQSPAESAQAYENRIRLHFKGPCRFDFILLGLGDNSHTVSLFPHNEVLHEKNMLIKETYIEEVKMYRITFTAPLINAAHTAVFLVYGSAKADAVHRVIELRPENIDEYPAQLVHPESGELYWFLDEAAAGKIKH